MRMRKSLLLLLGAALLGVALYALFSTPCSPRMAQKRAELAVRGIAVPEWVSVHVSSAVVEGADLVWLLELEEDRLSELLALNSELASNLHPCIPDDSSVDYWAEDQEPSIDFAPSQCAAYRVEYEGGRFLRRVRVGTTEFPGFSVEVVDVAED